MNRDSNSVRIELGQITNICFVIMPLDPLFKTEYDRVIRPAVERLGLECIRGDEIRSKQDVMGDIWKFIRKARVIIAELTEQNPNVLYEIGLAHAIGKPVIFLTRNEDDVSFDLKGLRYWLYDINQPNWGENLSNLITSIVGSALNEPSLSKYLEGIHPDIKLPEKPEPVSIAISEEVPIIDISGNWQGSWKRLDANIAHKGITFITQREAELSGTMTITFTKADTITVVQEVLVGSINGRKVTLNGVSYTYAQQGASTSYLLDNFELEVSEDSRKMEGEFHSKRGKGEAVFEKTT